MKNKKIETFLYEDLGFPILLINVPMRKIFGEWILDINLSKFQLSVLHMLIRKPISLTGKELRFIRKYFEMTITEFGHAFGVTHAAIVKWEAGQTRLSPTTEVYIRLYVLERLRAKDEEIGKLYHNIRIDQLAKSKKKDVYDKPLEIDVNEFLLAS